jgi:protein-S-isoprenylcysteine O-methyltransferase Ste14
MKTLPARFMSAIMLSILFFLAVFSLIISEHSTDSSWTNVHIWTGGLMLIGAAMHLTTKVDWIRAVFTRPFKSLNLQTRRNKRTDLGLFITGSLCTLGGIGWLFNPTHPSAHLHVISGMLMILLMLPHLALHWQWTMNTARHLFGAKSQASPAAQSED